MSEALTPWRATYAAGDWIVLSGPTSLVMLQPESPGGPPGGSAEWSTLVAVLWEEVLAASSLTEVAARVAAHGFDRMPSFAAFFWSAEGMRSLVRGEISVRKQPGGALVANGSGIRTWTEVGLAGIERVRIETPDAGDDHAVQLPLVVGAVYASVVWLDHAPASQIRSPQAMPAPRPPEPQRRSSDGSGEDPGTEVLSGLAGLAGLSGRVADHDLPSTEPLGQPASPVARLVVSDGNTVDLDAPVRIGRAPGADHPGDERVVLVTVRSPHYDVSRSHLQLVPDQGQVLVTDLGSTNGTRLYRPGGDRSGEALPAGRSVVVPLGSVLDLGDDVTVRVEPH